MRSIAQKFVIHTLIVLAIHCQHLQAESISVIGMDYPPFTSETMESGGINTELLRHYFTNKPNVTIKLKVVPPARAEHVLSSEHWCASFYPPIDLPHREVRFIKLRQEPVNLKLYRLMSDNDFRLSDLSELRGQRLAVLRYREEGKFQRKFIEAGLLITKVETISQGFKLLLANRVDYALGDNLSVQHIFPSIDSQQGLSRIQASDLTLDSFFVGVFVHPSCHPLFE
tara:strand:+ start:3488 stop:4168 length:681 start_codon:yes stop_codon:yes gene_type:complete